MSVIDSKSWKWRRRRLGWPEPIAFWMAFREAWYGRKGRGAPFSTLCLSPREKIGGGGGVRDATYQVFLPIRHQDHPLPQAHDLGRDIGRRAARVVLCARSEQLVDGFGGVEDDDGVAAEGKREDLAVLPRPFQKLRQRSVYTLDAPRENTTAALGTRRACPGNVLWGAAGLLGIAGDSQGWECRAGRAAVYIGTSGNFAMCR